MTTFIGNHIPIERIIVEDDDDDDLAIAASFLLHLKMLWIMKRVSTFMTGILRSLFNSKALKVLALHQPHRENSVKKFSKRRTATSLPSSERQGHIHEAL
ncbi:hypothetical protein E4U17_007559 [Claviceps sp. LM77 group G4]|nr:hypothetical protein E4U17_007559 [Claviceps sp. LM77 group G4]